MATELEELRGDLEWIDYLLAAAMSGLEELESNLAREVYASRDVCELITAYGVSFVVGADTVKAYAADVQEKALVAWQSNGAVDGGYYDRITARHRGKVLEHEHVTRSRTDA